jgi:hypothetical protein
MQAFSTTRELASWLVEPHAARTSVRIDTPELERILDRARASVEGDREGVSP